MSTDCQEQMAQLVQRRKEISAAIGQRKAQGASADDLLQESREISRQIVQLEQAMTEELSTDPEPEMNEVSLHTAVLRSLDEIAPLKAEWEALCDVSEVTDPSMTWEWLSAWASVYGARRQLRWITVRDDAGQLVGSAPLCLGEAGSHFLPTGLLGFMGSDTRNWSHGGVFAVAPAYQLVATRYILQAILALQPEWRALSLLRLPADNPTLHNLMIVAPTLGLSLTVVPDYEEVYGVLPPTYEAFIANLPSSKRRRELRRHEKRLQETFGSLRFLELKAAEQLDDWFDTMAQLTIARFHNTGRQSNFENEDFRRCWRAVAESFFHRGWFRATAVEVQGQVIAMQFGYLYRGTCYLMQPGFSPDFAQYGVYHLLVADHIRGAIAAGANNICSPGKERLHTTEYIAGRRQIVKVGLAPIGNLAGTWAMTRGLFRVAFRDTIKRLLRRGQPKDK